MSNPLRALRRLPWLALFQTAGFTIVAVFLLELLLSIGARSSLVVAAAIGLLFTPPLSLLLALAIAIGTGAISVYLLERFQRQVFINAGVLWALVACLVVMVYVRSLSAVPTLIPSGQVTLIGIILGIFGKGKPYWR